MLPLSMSKLDIALWPVEGSTDLMSARKRDNFTYVEKTIFRNNAN